MPPPPATYLNIFGRRIPVPYVRRETRWRVVIQGIGPIAAVWIVNVIPMPALLRATLMLVLAIVLFRAVRRFTNDLNLYIKNAKK